MFKKYVNTTTKIIEYKHDFFYRHIISQNTINKWKKTFNQWSGHLMMDNNIVIRI